MPTFLDHLRPHLDAGGRLNDFLEIRGGRVIFASALDLLDLVERHGAPLEVAFCPLIARRIREMQAHFAAARARAGYHGELVYAYATKANFAEEVVRTAVMSGAHYETSSAFDVRVAHRLWQSGVLPADRFVFCNGSKERPYLDAILDLRQAGCANVVPILDDPQEFEALASYPRPLLLGVRERKDPGDLAEGTTYGYDRFGMLPDELAALAARGDRVAGWLRAAARARAGAGSLRLRRRHADRRLQPRLPLRLRRVRRAAPARRRRLVRRAGPPAPAAGRRVRALQRGRPRAAHLPRWPGQARPSHQAAVVPARRQPDGRAARHPDRRGAALHHPAAQPPRRPG